MANKNGRGPAQDGGNENSLQWVAHQYGLRYVSDEQPGYRRKRWGQGFTYFDAEGNHVRDEGLRQRFISLVIPPAWTEVWISPDENGHIQVTGRDAKGRKQYIYHPRWEELRNLNKFGQMTAFGQALPSIRARVEEDLRLRGLSRPKVLALVVRLLDNTLIRVGNREYARRNNSYGLTTLQDEHLEIEGSRLFFRFMGKSGKEQEVRLFDPRLARLVKRCQELPGQHLFQYVDENGECCRNVDSSDVNDYLSEITGRDFTAKDFRTWGGTVLAAVELYELGPGENDRDQQKNVVAAVKYVAAALGNTPAVCRGYYIHPALLEAYQDGSLFPLMNAVLDETAAPGDRGRLSPPELAVIRLLQASA